MTSRKTERSVHGRRLSK